MFFVLLGMEFHNEGWKSVLFPIDTNSEPGQRLGINYVRTLQEHVEIDVSGKRLLIGQSSLGMMAISSVVWDCGMLMVDFLCSCYTSNLKDMHILELGCGTGLVGLSANLLGAKSVVMSDIVLTDGLERSIEENPSIMYEDYNWNDESIPELFTSRNWNTVLCSDVLYESKNHPALLRLIDKLAFERLIIAYKRRHDVEEKQFFEKLSEFCSVQVVRNDCIELKNLSQSALSGLFIVVAERR